MKYLREGKTQLRFTVGSVAVCLVTKWMTIEKQNKDARDRYCNSYDSNLHVGISNYSLRVTQLDVI